MKMTQTIGLASALLLAAGCAHEEQAVRTDESVSPGYGFYSGRSEYHTPNNYSSQPSGAYNGGTYSGGISQGSRSQSDNTIVAQVREALQRDPELALVMPNIQIGANNGAIILNGSVQSEEQKRQILSKVQQVTGVVTVNNQLNVMAGPNGQGNSSDSQMNPTGNTSGANRLYKDAANGRDNSTNNALNPTSRDTPASQLYRASNQGEGTSSNSSQLSPTSNSEDQSLPPGSQLQSGRDQNTNNIAPNNALNPTSGANGQNQLYQQGSQGEKENQQDMSNTSTNSLNPTSRGNGSSRIFQGNPGENGENSNTNSNRQMP